MSIQVIDIIYIVIILIVGIGGFKKGFFSQIITIVGIIAALFLAYFFNDDLSPYVADIIGNHSFVNIVSFILIFVVVIIIALLINHIFKTTVNNLGSEGVDKILGFLFGLVQGLFICVALTALLVIQPIINPEVIFNKSILGSKLIEVLPTIERLLPESEIIDSDVVEKNI